MPTNLSAVVQRVHQAHPELLQANTHASCGEFLQRVCAEPECKAERVGLLSKSPTENGYTYPNGIRGAVDVIAWPNGERCDIIQSAAGSPAPGGPTWQVIPPEHWRPSNVWIDISSWPIYNSGVGPPLPPGPLEVDFGWFCWMTAWASWPTEAQQNFDWIRQQIAPRGFRVMLCVEGQSHGTPDPWRDAGVFIDQTWDDRYKRMLDQALDGGFLIHPTVYGGRNQTPTHDDRRRFHDRIVAASEDRWAAIGDWEMMNEYQVNHWTAEEVRSAGLDLAGKLPGPYHLALSSPHLAHSYVDGRQPTNEEMQVSFDVLYANQTYANLITIHTMRDGGKWSDPFAFNAFYPTVEKINNEPPGPGASSGAEDTTAAEVERDLQRTRDAGWRRYVGHAEWCPWNGHLPVEYYNGWREIRMLKELPGMPACAQVLKTGSGEEPEMPIPPYDEGWITQTVVPAFVRLYTQYAHPLDSLYPVWVARTQYDVDAGLSKEESLQKHLQECEQALKGAA